MYDVYIYIKKYIRKEFFYRMANVNFYSYTPSSASIELWAAISELPQESGDTLYGEVSYNSSVSSNYQFWRRLFHVGLNVLKNDGIGRYKDPSGSFEEFASQILVAGYASQTYWPSYSDVTYGIRVWFIDCTGNIISATIVREGFYSQEDVTTFGSGKIYVKVDMGYIFA